MKKKDLKGDAVPTIYPSLCDAGEAQVPKRARQSLAVAKRQNFEVT